MFAVLTNDEIYQAMNECGRVSYIHRVDSTRFCTIVRFRFAIAVSQAMRLKQIAGENVTVVRYTERRCFVGEFEQFLQIKFIFQQII